MPNRSDDPPTLQEFEASLGTRDHKNVTTYLTTVRDFVGWLALQPGGRKRSEEKNQTGVIFGKHCQSAQLFSRSSLL
jgi:hypothetical protein